MEHPSETFSRDRRKVSRDTNELLIERLLCAAFNFRKSVEEISRRAIKYQEKFYLCFSTERAVINLYVYGFQLSLFLIVSCGPTNKIISWERSLIFQFIQQVQRMSAKSSIITRAHAELSFSGFKAQQLYGGRGASNTSLVCAAHQSQLNRYYFSFPQKSLAGAF